MKKLILCTLIITLCTHLAPAQEVGKWHMHRSYHNVTQSEPAGSLVYVLAAGSLFSYNNDDAGIQTYHRNNYLNDTEISIIRYIPQYKTLLIAYQNGNIDLLHNDEHVYNLPDFKNKQLPYEKTIKNIDVYGPYAYLSTLFGVVVVNVEKKEFTNTYILDKQVNACAQTADKLLVATTQGLYVGNRAENLLNPANWTKASADVYRNITEFDGHLVGNIIGVGIVNINPQTYERTRIVSNYSPFFNVYNDRLLAGKEDHVIIFNSLTDYVNLPLGTGAANLKHLSYANNTYWASRGEGGLIGQKLNKDANRLEDITHPIVPLSPKRNLPYYMAFFGERLYIAGGGIYFNRLNRPGTIMTYDGTNWDAFEEETITPVTNLRYRDVTSIAQDPLDPDHHFAATAGEGLYEFKEGKFVKQHSLHNSPLQSALPNNDNKAEFVRINGLKYDAQNNLWMLNSETQRSVHALKPDGTWVSFEFTQTLDVTNLEHTLVDRRGWIWATTLIAENPGILCINTNKTLDNKADDTQTYIYKFVNQEGTTITPITVNCIAEDKNGAIWLGTDKGPLVFNNPAKVFDDDFRCTQIKVPRNDGSSLADFLLIHENIKTIVTDGANRKWIGTQSNGAYLISEDGLETVAHFTTQNSPLPSDNITAIAIHPTTGEVFIGTNNGLVSYQSDAVEPQDSFSSNILIYPNPVHPHYDGLITIKGLVKDSDVKITDAAGNLVHTTTSLGGMCTWDGRNQRGKRVSSGVYFVLAANAEGSEGVVGKLMIIK